MDGLSSWRLNNVPTIMHLPDSPSSSCSRFKLASLPENENSLNTLIFPMDDISNTLKLKRKEEYIVIKSKNSDT